MVASLCGGAPPPAPRGRGPNHTYFPKFHEPVTRGRARHVRYHFTPHATSVHTSRADAYRALQYPPMPASPGAEGGRTWSPAYPGPSNRPTDPCWWRRKRCAALTRPRCSWKWPERLTSRIAMEAMAMDATTSRPIAAAGAASKGSRRWRRPPLMVPWARPSRSAWSRRATSMLPSLPESDSSA